MNHTLVKICGVRSPDIALAVAEAGADLMGLIFATSKRQVSESDAHEIIGALDDTVVRPKTVGVFVNERSERMNTLAAVLGLDYVQLHGDEPVEVQAELERPVIRALRLRSGTAFSEACRRAEQFLDCSAPAWALLLDTYMTGAYGGTGVRGDWRLAQRLAERYPVILSGGLQPETVVDALQCVRPLGLDVSSGVETDGTKDPEKIRHFVTLARSDRATDSPRSDAINVVTSRG